jgi:hypothetical protein
MPALGKTEQSKARRASIVDRLRDFRNGIFRRASTSNAIPSDLEYNPADVRRFSVITQDEAEKRLHTSSAHIDFASFDWTQELTGTTEKDKEDKRNEPNYSSMSRPNSAGEKRKNLVKEVAIYAGHSDTELDKEPDQPMTPISSLRLDIS